MEPKSLKHDPHCPILLSWSQGPRPVPYKLSEFGKLLSIERISLCFLKQDKNPTIEVYSLVSSAPATELTCIEPWSQIHVSGLGWAIQRRSRCSKKASLPWDPFILLLYHLTVTLVTVYHRQLLHCHPYIHIPGTKRRQHQYEKAQIFPRAPKAFHLHFVEDT